MVRALSDDCSARFATAVKEDAYSRPPQARDWFGFLSQLDSEAEATVVAEDCVVVDRSHPRPQQQARIPPLKWFRLDCACE